MTFAVVSPPTFAAVIPIQFVATIIFVTIKFAPVIDPPPPVPIREFAITAPDAIILPAVILPV